MYLYRENRKSRLHHVITICIILINYDLPVRQRLRCTDDEVFVRIESRRGFNELTRERGGGSC